MEPISRHWGLDPEVVYLDHGAFGACPLAVLARQTALRTEIELEPAEFFMKRLEPMLDAARAELAVFIGAGAEDLVFVPNATTGINAVLRAARFEGGDELLVTNHGYSAIQNAASYVAERAGARVVTADVPFPISDPDEVVRAIIASTTARTRLVIVDHVTSSTGLVWPIEQIVRALADRGIDTLVDGAHAPGMVPLDVSAIGAAYYIGTCHKWLCAPKGSGFLWVRRDRQVDVHPTSISHGFRSFRDDRPRLHLEFDWVGTSDPTPYLCVPDALRFMAGLVPGGLPALMAKNRRAAILLQQSLDHALSSQPSAPPSMVGAMVAVPIREARDDEYGDDLTTDPLHKLLLQRDRIDVAVLAWPRWPRRVLRASVQAYNTAEELDRLTSAVSSVGTLS